MRGLLLMPVRGVLVIEEAVNMVLVRPRPRSPIPMHGDGMSIVVQPDTELRPDDDDDVDRSMPTTPIPATELMDPKWPWPRSSSS